MTNLSSKSRGLVIWELGLLTVSNLIRQVAMSLEIAQLWTTVIKHLDFNRRPHNTQWTLVILITTHCQVRVLTTTLYHQTSMKE